jgi:hypothetical protein
MNTYKPARLFFSATQRSFSPTISNTPDLPVVDWSAVGQTAPELLESKSTTLSAADAIVITWADAEWAAMQHVFCTGGKAMAYSKRTTGKWSGWTKYAEGLPSNPPEGWSFWGEWRLVRIGTATVMLFKSNTHLDFPGKAQLTELIQLLVKDVRPKLILSIGTAGGAQTGDHVGTIRAVRSGTLYEQGQPSTDWPVYTSGWEASDTVISNEGFQKLLFPIPTTAADLESLCTQFNQHYGTSYTVPELDPDGLNLGDASPGISDDTGSDLALLTTPTFVVGTTSGTYQDYACIEMDDAVIGEVCEAAGTLFGFIRNISDPVQNAALPAEVQGNWGSAVYDTYGLYTSYNGAITAWAMLAAMY